MKYPTVTTLPAWARRSVLLAASLAATAPAWAQISLSKTADLAFGGFVASSGGTVTVAPNGGRSKGGSVLLVAQGASAAAAQFTVSGTDGATYAITLPVNDLVTLTDGSHTMAVNNFTSSPSATGTLAGGSQLLRVGATLTAGNAQTPGSYTGSFAVFVNYN
ncbi:MAG: DUF4402 domain-containing protein [Rhodoferax sp.]